MLANVARAAAAIQSGYCEMVMSVAAAAPTTRRVDDQRSYRSEFRNPTGIQGPPGAFGLLMHRYMHQYNLANDRSTEVLLYLTAQRQISKAIEIGGIAEKQKAIAWVSFNQLPEKLSTLVSLDESIISHENFDYSSLNLDDQVYSELTNKDKQKIVMTRTATLPVQPR